MHLIVPFAAPLSDAGRAAAAGLRWPQLAALLVQMGEPRRDEGDEWSLSPPHERALARALGFSGADGSLPWAAHAARADGVEVGNLAWGQITPAHWHLGTEQMSLLDPAGLMLDEAGSRFLFDTVRELFTSEGYAVAWGAPLRWYVAHESLAALPTASLDRVIGRNVDRWLGSDPAARRIRRLQSEVQMLLHGHAFNEDRERRGLLPVNSFWISGCGVAQTARPVDGLRVEDSLRTPALADDWAAWAKAWDVIDSQRIPELTAATRAGTEVQLTLCGEHSSVSFQSQQPGLWRRLRAAWTPAACWPILESL
jgi:hypothetical protein